MNDFNPGTTVLTDMNEPRTINGKEFPSVASIMAKSVSIDGVNYLPAQEYADLQGISFRSVKRYLAEEELPGAIFYDKKWLIPADAERSQHKELVVRNGTEVQVHAVQGGSSTPLGTMKDYSKMPTLEQALDHQTAYVTVEEAANLMGITEYAIRNHPEEYGVVPRGRHGGAVVPQAVIRKIAGL
jgi:hypothetical protein